MVTLRPGFNGAVKRQLAAALELLDGRVRPSEFAAADALGWLVTRRLQARRERMILDEYVQAWVSLPGPEPDP